jgi:DNA-binding CsgD family transcriptional regulator
MSASGFRTARLGPLVERAYDSAFERKPFASLLPELAAAVGADAAHINVWVPELGGELAVSDGMPEHLIRVYREHHWRHDLWRHALERQRIPVGRAFAGHQIVHYGDLIKSEMYNDALRGYGLFDICGGRIFAHGNQGAAISLMRARGRPFYNEREVARLGAVLPHMARAFKIRLQLGDLARQRDAFAAMADAFADGALLVGMNGLVVHASAKAQVLLDASDGPLRLERGRLRARDPAADRRLQALFARRGGTARLGEPAVIPLPCGSSSASKRLKLLPTALPGGLFALIGSGYVAVIERPAPAGDAVERAAARYALTRAECELLGELVSGHALVDSAARLDRSLNTVRNQLQAIFAKTGTHRQAELVAKVLRCAA